jgi:hypothetical protein
MAVFCEAWEMAVNELESSTVARWWKRPFKLASAGNA